MGRLFRMAAPCSGVIRPASCGASHLLKVHVGTIQQGAHADVHIGRVNSLAKAGVQICAFVGIY